MFDLRNSGNDAAVIENYIIELFKEMREMRRIMIIEMKKICLTFLDKHDNM